MDIKTDKAESKIQQLKNKLNKIKDEKVDVRLDISQALQSIEQIETSFKALKAEMESGIKLNIDFGDGAKQMMADMDALTKQAQNSAKMGVEAMNANFTPDSSFSDMMKNMSKLSKEMQSSVTKAYGEYKGNKTAYDELQSAKDIVSVMKELDKVNKDVAKSEGIRSKESISALDTRKKGLEDELKAMQRMYQNQFDAYPSENPMVKQTQDLLNYQKALRDVAQEQKEQQAVYKEQVKLENERYKLLSKADKRTTGASEAAELRSQAAAIEKQIASLENANSAWEKMSDTQRAALTSMKAQNETALQSSRQLASAQQEDRARAESQKAVYSELEKSVRDYYNTMEKLSQLQAQADAEAISGKDSLKLDNLKQELSAREEIVKSIKKQIETEGLSDSTRDSKVAALEKERTIRASSVADIAKVNAELKKTEDAYKDIMASVQRQAQLTKQLESAGDNEAAKIRELISLEEQRQSQIRETNNLKEKGTREMDEQISNVKEEIKLNERNAEEIRQARGIDQYNERLATSSTLTDLINPRQIFNDGKQVFQYLYSNVKQLDDAMVAIRKVADATPQEFATFEREIFGLASSVGKSADQYAVSVERWASAGYELQEANKMAGYSTMGAFVGNVDEAAMVDYMAVPLIAYKDAGLEAWDVLNAMNEVANNNAIEMDTLGAAYSRAASTAANAGTSFAELTGLIGAAEETTRLGGETIGTSIRTMDINIGKIAARDTKGFEDKFDFLEGIGVNIMDANGELSSTYDVLKQLQSVWGDLDTVAQTKAATMLAGSRGQAVMTAWMNNWERVQKIQSEATGQLGFAEGTGSAYDEFEAMQDSMEFKQAQLKNAWAEFIQVVTGGKEPFMAILELTTSIVEKMTELAENDGIRNFATGLAKAFAGIVGTTALTQGFGVLAKGVGATFNTVGKNGSVGKIGGMFNSINVGIMGLIPKIGLAITAFQILDPIIESIFGVSISDALFNSIVALGDALSPTTAKFREFREAVEKSNEHMANAKQARVAIESQKELVKAYEDMGKAREKVYAESGDWKDLIVPEEQFASIRDQHNSLVEQMELPISLNIELNNQEHVMEQMESLRMAMLRLEYDEIKLSVTTGQEAYADIFSDKDMSLESYSENLATMRKINKEIAELQELQQKDKRELTKEQLAELSTNNINKILASYRDELGDIAGMKDLQAHILKPENIKAMQDYGKNIGESVKFAMEQTDPGTVIDDLFRNADTETQKMAYVSMMNEITSESRKLSGASKDFETLSKSVGELGNTTELNADSMINAWNDLGSYLGDYQQLAKTDVMKDLVGNQSIQEYIMAGDTIEENAKRLNEVMALMPQAIGEAQDSISGMTEDLTSLGEKLGITSEQTEHLAKVAQEEGQAGFLREVFSMDGADGAATAAALGLSEAWGAMFYEMEDTALKTGKDIGVVYGETLEGITAGVESMGESLASKWHLLDPISGDLNYLKVMEDLNKFKNDDFNVEFGIRTKQGELQQVENFYRTLEMVRQLGEDNITELGLEFSTDPREMLEELINAAADGKIEFNAELNEEGILDSLEVVSKESGEKIEIPYVPVLDENDEINKILGMDGKEIKIKIGLEDTTGGFDDIGWLGGHENADQGAMAYLRERLFPQIQGEYGDISLNIDANVSGEEAVQQLYTDLQALESSNEGKQILLDIATKLNMGEDAELTADSIMGQIWYMLEDGMTEEEAEIVVDVLTKLNLVDDPNAEEIKPEEVVPEEDRTQEVEIDVITSAAITEADGASISDAIPSELTTFWEFLKGGDADPAEIEGILDNIPPQMVTDYTLNLGNSEEALESIRAAMEGMSQDQAVDFLVNVLGIEDAETVKQLLDSSDGDTAEASISVSSQGLAEAAEAGEAVTAMDGLTATGAISVDSGEADTKITETEGKLDGLTAKEAKPRIGGDDSVFTDIMSRVDASLMRQRTTTVRILGDASAYNRVLESLRTRSVTVDIKGRRSASVAVGQRLGTSFSTSVGSQLTGRSSSQAVGRSASTETKVNEDVWRYWAKEMFTGLPIEKSLDELANQIKMAGDNQDELVRLYKEQIKAIDRQIAFEKDMQKAQQDEMNSILADLRKEGFTTSGNQITNLDRAKTFSGDKASEVDSLLSDWKSLYESIESLDTTISKLNLDKFNAEEDIRNAKIEKELQRIEARLKTTEALMRSVDNNTSIQATKERLVNSQDYDLVLGVNEQGLNTASQAVRDLIKEYNSLSKTSVEYEENAEEVYGTLEDLKSTILDNADAILDYRENMKSVELDRLLTDFNKFADVMAKNGEVISNNVGVMQEGLLSGQTLSNLAGMGTLDINRKTQLERDYELRLQLEADLNNALLDYSNRNIDKTAKEANQVLQIEANKYNQLLQMAKDYSTGAAIKPSEISVIGDTELTDTANQQQYDLWKNKLEKFTVDYSKEYADMVERYQKAIDASASNADKQALRNQMIVEQLKMQEQLYKDIIDYNNQFIELSEKELENSNLTTEQRNQLLDAIEEYRLANIDAQNAIRDTVADRFEFEFTLLDKATEKAQQYSDSLAHMLEVAELINVSPADKATIYDAIYDSLINQYSTAKDQLKSLTEQQAEFEVDSYEWNILAERIAEVREQIKGFGVDALNANRDVLNNALESVRDTWEKGLLDDKTLEQWKDYHENWVSGVEKELQLENLRQKSIGLENDLIRQRLEMLDRQDDVSKKDLDYLDKQMKVIELEQKLANLSDQRDVQTLVRRDDGTYAWDYVADQTEYDKTQKELNDAKIELEKYRREQRQSYADSLGNIIGRAQAGGYKTTDELVADLDRLKAVYGTVLADIPDLDSLSLEQIIAAYDKYLEMNDLLATDLIGGGGDAVDNTISTIGSQFEESFMNISSEFGKVIGAELRAALGISADGATPIGGVTYNIASVELPNVSDANVVADFFNELSRTVDQDVNSK